MGLVEGGTLQPHCGTSILSHYITRMHNSFQNLGPPIPETPELTVSEVVGTPVSSETGLQDAEGESGSSSPAHVLVHREQESKGAGDLPLAEDLETKVGS